VVIPVIQDVRVPIPEFKRQRLTSRQSACRSRGAGAGPLLFSIEAKRKRHRRGQLFHSPRRQPRNAIADIALGYRLKIIEVRCACVRHTVLLSQQEFGRYIADRRYDWREGDRIQDGDGGLACENQHGALRQVA